VKLDLKSQEDFIRDIEELPALPTTVIKVVNLTQSEISSAKDLAKIIAMDKALTASVLKLCNSPIYGLQRRVESIQQAVALMGLNTLLGLVMTIATNKTFRKNTDGYLLEPGELWRSAITCGFLAQKIAETVEPGLKDIAFTAGVIHDIGKIICSKYLLQDFSKVIEMARGEKISFNLAEKRVMGFDHNEIGGYISRKWNFPDHINACILHHHAPANADAKNLKIASIVHVADMICLSMGIGVGGDGLFYEMNEDAGKLLKIDSRKMDGLIGFLLDSMDKMEAFLE